jgi:hypothetical protein
MVQEESLKGLEEVLDYCPSSGTFRWKSSGKLAGYYDPKGYVQIRVFGRLWQAHHLAFYLMGVSVPDLVDHRNRVKHDNSWKNLRPADKRLNAINSGLPSNNTSSVKGVSWHKASGKWTAQIKDKGVKIHLGSYAKLEDAAEARRKAEEELWGDL